MSEHLIHAGVQSTQGLMVRCSASEHEYILDEPVGSGGTDLGMNPLQSLLSAVGACAIITAKVVAPKRKIELIDIRVDLQGEVGRNEQGKKQLTNITSKFFIKANNSKDEIERFIDFVLAHCPAHNTLMYSASMNREITIE